MLLALIICQLAASVIANPFHKYPSVFLLDVGNEELEKTNTEQIRLSVPGGSVALRYPAIGDGDLIGHLRVSSIDFGTALKANIVDGGPGYKYVVLVLMGNPGAPYDAVVTVQTVNEQSLDALNVLNAANRGSFAVPVDEAENNAAEDVSDGPPLASPPLTSYQSESIVQNSNAELTQSSNNVYNYVENEAAEQSAELEENNDDSDASNHEQDIEEDDDDASESDNDETDSENDQSDIHKEYTDDVDQVDDSSIQVKGIADSYDEDNDEDSSPEIEQFAPDDHAEDKPANLDEVVYGEADQVDEKPDYQQVPMDYEDAYEMDPIFNDGEVHNNGDKYRDSNNNNYIDSEDNYAVAY